MHLMPRLDDLLTNDAVLSELGHRLQRLRLQRNKSQVQLGQEAGVGRLTIQRIERGDSVQTATLVKVMRALDLLHGLDAALPESVELPIEQLERERRTTRRRARRKAPADAPWRWGAEP
jgi:transcriptional regulator with XRE-family HTH domain